MKTFIMTLMALLFAQPVYAQEDEAYTGVPPFSLEEAIGLATQCGKEKNIDFANAALYGAMFYPYGRYAVKTPFWEVLWQVPMAQGGSTAISVLPDRTCKIALGE